MIRRCQASPALGVARFSELLPLPDGTCDRVAHRLDYPVPPKTASPSLEAFRPCYLWASGPVTTLNLTTN